MNIVVGTSFYIDPFIPEDVKLLSVEEVQLKINATVGVRSTKLRIIEFFCRYLKFW